MEFSLIIPLWNEEKNLEALVAMLEQSGLAERGMAEAVLVNNGSLDGTGKLLDRVAAKYPWVTPVQLSVNQNYGGGVYEGARYAKSDMLAYIPGDLQVSADDLASVWAEYRALAIAQGSPKKLFVKGHRTIRLDPMQTRIVSAVYTVLGNLVLGLEVKDLNGLPKLFHRDLLDLIPTERMRTFVFDAQLLSLARRDRWTIKEVPVTFHARRVGLSSWSAKRVQTYKESFKNLVRLRTLRLQPGVPLERVPGTHSHRAVQN